MEMNRLRPEERYSRDNTFRAFVDMLTQMIAVAEYTPTEIREAAILAAIRYETIHSRPVFIKNADGSLDRIDAYHGKGG